MGSGMDLVVLTDLPDCRVVATSRVLKRADAQPVIEATQLLRLARQREAGAEAQAQAIRRQAREEGLREGREQARVEYAARLVAAEAARHAGLRELSPFMIDIVTDAVAVLLRQSDRTALMASAVEAVDGLLKQARWARLRVHPDQVEAARAALEAGAIPLATVVADARMDPLECSFETDVGIADTGLQAQLESVRKAVAQALDVDADPAASAARGRA